MNNYRGTAASLVLLLSIGTEAGQEWQRLHTLPEIVTPSAAVGEPTRERALRERQAHLEVRWDALGGAVLSLSTMQPGGLGQLDPEVLAAGDLPLLQTHIHRALGELSEILHAASAVEFRVMSVEDYEWDTNARGGYRVSLTQKVGAWPYRDSELFLNGEGYILSLHLGYLDPTTLHPPPAEWISVEEGLAEAQRSIALHLGRDDLDADDIRLRLMQIDADDSGGFAPAYYFQHRRLVIKVNAATGESVISELWSRRAVGSAAVELNFGSSVLRPPD